MYVHKFSYIIKLKRPCLVYKAIAYEKDAQV